ncbi:hypothetical protein R5R35_006637 [Gryllus longicercus]|uniref:Tektin n=1 Tax=Gryllus longicercus TaxID=2509291 RepID=A0AAN9VGL4_9ORTH|nr:Tektin-1 [Gryllus bimaculatus]
MATLKPLVAVPPPPSRFTLREWDLNNRIRLRSTQDQQHLADRILSESRRVCDEANEITKLNKSEVDQRLKERIEDIQFRKRELERERNECCREEEALVTYQERILDEMEALKEKALKICSQCIIMRECRLGIDLVRDDVEVQLQKEADTINGALSLLQRTLEQTKEQIRSLRSTVYFIDRDHEDKSRSLEIDEECMKLKETNLNLSMYHGYSRLDAGTVSAEDWHNFSGENISRAAKEINTARPLRVYVDTILKQVCADLQKQCEITNEAFRRRISETKAAKRKLEKEHAETVKRANEMMRNITSIEKAIAEKEGFVALAHTRLGKRAARPGVELTRDEVEARLVVELKDLERTVALLQMQLAEAQASLRYLLKTQVQLEEDINIKTNSLKIDEVDCMTLRESMDYRAY